MNPNISRRSLLRAGAGTLALGLMAACTTTKSGTTTTVTLNVAEVVDYGNAHPVLRQHGHQRVVRGVRHGGTANLAP
ncbi:hypothetical protein ACOZ4Y_02370 [Komagataeibacter rhaeticus]